MSSNDKTVRVAFGAFLVVAIAGGAAVGVRFWNQKNQNVPVLTQAQACSKAAELTKLYYGSVNSEIRLWIKAQGSDATELIFGCLDNRVDPHSKTRIAALNAVASFKADALKEVESKAWSEALRKLARSQFHDGQELEHYLREADGF